MYRTALRSSTSALRTTAARSSSPLTSTAPRRLLSTAPKAKKGTWKGMGLRWALAAGAVYYYNTSPLFAEEFPAQVGTAPTPFSDADLPTIDALIEEKRKQAAASPAPTPKKITAAPTPARQENNETAIAVADPAAAGGELEPGSPEALEQEASQQGAFDPVTGEINWDCPCLGGMAHGPCGEEFKAAFSCFVHSTEEPKGMDCIEKFQGMQDCFRQHPDIYGAELADDENDEAGDAAPEAAGAVARTAAPEQSGEKRADEKAEVKKESQPKESKPAELPTDVIPKAAVDATGANEETQEAKKA